MKILAIVIETVDGIVEKGAIRIRNFSWYDIRHCLQLRGTLLKKVLRSFAWVAVAKPTRLKPTGPEATGSTMIVNTEVLIKPHLDPYSLYLFKSWLNLTTTTFSTNFAKNISNYNCLQNILKLNRMFIYFIVFFL